MSKTKTPTPPAPPVKGAARTAERKALLLSALSEAHGIITPACRAVGVDRSTYYDWLETDEDFARSVHEVQQEQLDFVEGKLLDRINQGDTTAAIFYLKTRGKERGYVERTELTGSGGKALIPDIKIEVVDATAPDE